eukprot:95678-Chlamydomonas_euryale.AAC.2
MSALFACFPLRDNFARRVCTRALSHDARHTDVFARCLRPQADRLFHTSRMAAASVGVHPGPFEPVRRPTPSLTARASLPLMPSQVRGGTEEGAEKGCGRCKARGGRGLTPRAHHRM